MSTGHKSGFVAIIGKPNAGKSTLLNALMGKKLVIATPKAQTTRHRILGILNGENHQVIFSDTPGLIRPKYELQRKMVGSIKLALEDADLFLMVADVNESFPEEDILELASKQGVPKILALNKCDVAEPDLINFRKRELTEEVEFDRVIEISALRKRNLDELLEAILELLPEGPEWYPKDSLSDRPERFFVAEIVREKLFLYLDQELPYSTEVEVVDFEEDEDIVRISADIHVERRNHKGMIIGKQGKMIKKLGTQARREIEAFLNKKVHIELYVRVSEGWKDDSRKLRGFGYD